MKNSILYFLLSICSATAIAEVDTVSIKSAGMHKDVKCVVITPSDYSKNGGRYPVVYLLHGARGNYANWVTRVPDMQQLADENRQLIVCPDGAFMSWYFDSPIDSSIRYETFIAVEVPAFVDSHYRTLPDRLHRAISGLSMGGQGALFIAFRHAETFGACGSMSGALNVGLVGNGYGIDKVLGDIKTNVDYYKNWSAINVIETAPKDSLAIIIDCGLQDFISFMSRAVHEKMIKLKIPHDYIERPGRHDWNYWKKAVRYQLLFFKEFFKRTPTDKLEIPGQVE